MKKKVAAIILATTMVLPFTACESKSNSIAVNKEENAISEKEKEITPKISTDFNEDTCVNQIFHTVEFNIPSDWDVKSNNDNTFNYYYPPSGQVSGKTESMLSVCYMESNQSAAQNPDANIELAIENMSKDTNVTIKSSKDFSMPNTYAKIAQYSQIIDGKKYDGDILLFTIPDAVIGFIFFSSEGFQIDYSEDFAKIIDSIQLARLDFFDTYENERQVKALLSQAKIEELNEFLNEYIEQNSPDESDSVYKIQDIIAPIVAIKNKLYLEKDEFNNKYKLYYNGLTEISSNAYILPYSTDGGFELEIGFIGNDWIFMKNAILKYGDGENDSQYISCDSWDGTQEVLNDGYVLERGYGRIYKTEDVEKIVSNSENDWILRLYGQDDKTLDHILTNTEKDALITFSTFFKATSTFEDLSKNYKK